MQEFTNKVAVVTGAASGIGKAIAAKCLDKGMNVVLSDIEEEALDKTVSEFQIAGHNNLIPVLTDVSIETELVALKEKTIKTFGGVHLLFNNAGIGAGAGILQSSKQDWEWTMGVNLWSVIHGVRIFLPDMIAQDTDCHIVNTASAAGLVPGVTSVSYSVTKFGVVALSEHMYLDEEIQNSKVGVSVLCPGFVQTNISDAERNRPRNMQNQPAELADSEEDEEFRNRYRQYVNDGMPASQLAEIVFDAIQNNQFYILTHADFNEAITLRANNIVSGSNPVMMDLG